MAGFAGTAGSAVSQKPPPHIIHISSPDDAKSDSLIMLEAADDDRPVRRAPETFSVITGCKSNGRVSVTVNKPVGDNARRCAVRKPSECASSRSDLTYVKVGISLAVKERFAGEAKSFFHFDCIETRKGR